VWNGPWRSCNERTLAWWQKELVEGKKLHVVGGSDTHRPDQYVKHGMPTTWVKTASNSAEGILIGIDKGNVFLSYSPEGPVIELICGEWMMGDTVTNSSYPIELTIVGLLEGDTIKIISDKGIEHTHTASNLRFEDHLEITDQGFYRIEVWRYFSEVNRTLMAAMCNPIYIDVKGI